MRKKLIFAILLSMIGFAVIPSIHIFAYSTVTEIVSCRYDYIFTFAEGLAIVELDGKYGFIDQTGKEVIPVQYDIPPYSPHPDFEPSRDFHNGLARVQLSDKVVYIDKTGKEIMSYDNMSEFSEGMANVFIHGKFGFVNNKGKLIVPAKYNQVNPFQEGLAAVSMDNKWGFIDKTGKEVVPLQYNFAFSFNKGLAVVGLGTKYGTIDKTGKEVTPPKYDDIQLNEDGWAIVRLDNKYGFIDEKGKEVTPLQYDDIASPFLGLIDRTGKVVIRTLYDGINSYDSSSGLVEVFQLDEKYGFKFGLVDLSTGKEMIPMKYDSLHALADAASDFPSTELGVGDVMAGLNDKFGLLDRTGKEIVPLQYDMISSFTNSHDLLIKKNNLFGVIDRTGKEILPIQYDYMYQPFYREGDIGGFTIVQLKGKSGLMEDKTRSLICASDTYEYSFPLGNGLWCIKDANDKYGIVKILHEPLLRRGLR